MALTAEAKHCIVLLIYWFNVGYYSESVEVHTYTHAAVSVREYSSYGSATMLEYKVPEKALDVHWFFRSFKYPHSCKHRNILIYLQYGSYPVINPLNETFPPHFNTRRTHKELVVLKSDNRTVRKEVSFPLPGSWFGAAFIGDEKDDSIGVQGVSENCRYSVSATQVTRNIESVESLEINMHQTVTIDKTRRLPSDKAYTVLRFYIFGKTWNYQIKISRCVVKENGTSTNYTSCPIIAVVRANSLPDPAEKEFGGQISVNCSEHEDCILEKKSPGTEVWHYLYLEATDNLIEEVSFSVMIETKECQITIHSLTTASPHTTITSSAHNITAMVPTTATPGGWNQNTTMPSNLTSLPEIIDPNPWAESMPTVIGIQEVNTDIVTVDAFKKQMKAEKNVSSTQTADVNSLRVIEGNCQNNGELARFSLATRSFFTSFRRQYWLHQLPNLLMLTDRLIEVYKYEIRPLIDTGGTLTTQFNIQTASISNATWKDTHWAMVKVCIQRGSIPVTDEGPACDPEFTLELNTENETQSLMYFPYPEPGPWYFSAKATCYLKKNGTQTSIQVSCEEKFIPVVFQVVVMPCVDGGCGENGRCAEYYSGIFHFSSCRCVARWRGYGCTDGTVASSDAEQMVALLLLTLSNLAFSPAIGVSVYRHFFAEALVYTYNMVFSGLYHACDGDRKYSYCVMPYGVLQYCDFFASISSFWVTIIAMSKLGYRPKAFLYILGALGLTIGVAWDRRNLWTFMVPFVTALIIMFICWGRRCYRTKKLYPSKWRWILFLVPGTLVAGTGLIIFAFFETESNYQYTHSAWHVCMATCICFLLPPGKKKEGYLLSKENSLPPDPEAARLNESERGTHREL